ncbi:hypothetical protein ACVDHI_00415 [Aeromonas sp. 25-248]
MPKKVEPIRSSSGTFSARNAAKYLREMIVEGRDPLQVLPPYYIAAVCAHMEGLLNNCFVEYLHRRLGTDYSQRLKPFLFMRVEERMELAPLLLSDFKYKLNSKHQFVKDALRIFDMRNHFLHVKDLWHYANVDYGDNGKIIGFEYLVKNHPDPYREIDGENIDIDEIEVISGRFLKRFRSMPNTINRKNFKPDPWLIEVKRP